MNPLATNNTPPTHVRHNVSAWLAAAAAIAYLCRNSIAVAEKTIRIDLGLTEAQMGMILGPAFFWAYALAQIPAGSLGERFGSRRTIPVLSVIWSLATACIVVAGSAASLIAARIGMGIAQAGLFPCSTNSIANWHPQIGRAFASGTLGAFMSVGGAIGVSLVAAGDGESKRMERQAQSPQLIAVRFHADWCAVCKPLVPNYAKLVADSQDLPVLFVTLDMTDEITRRQSEYLASSLGIADIWAEQGNRVGVIKLLDAGSKDVLASISASDDLQRIESVIRTATSPHGTK